MRPLQLLSFLSFYYRQVHFFAINSAKSRLHLILLSIMTYLKNVNQSLGDETSLGKMPINVTYFAKKILQKFADL